ncbi:hypothetical protein SAMD00023353_3101280 [Rosellinia necatrix]|uniref:F-box domain-containing protein n=1 Tax=Rosellinia necatrix TaxID=77044 RepID=A0A1W2TSJ8_ROSNE|nr:hypothetical protein SAMD00023353_3101280 [Rosellinia necatrix]
MQTPSILENLPLEIFLIILGYLSHNHLLPPRLVSKYFSTHVTPLVFSDLSLVINDLDEVGFHQNLWFVEHLATSRSRIGPAVRTLRIASLYSPRYHAVGGGRVLRDDEPGPNESITREVLSKYLTLLLVKLQNLESVFWTYDAKRDPACYLIPVAQSLASLPKLKILRVKIELVDPDNPESQLPPLHAFRHLSELSVSSDYNLPAAFWENQVRPAVKASAELVSFSLKLDNGDKVAPPPVQAIMGGVPRPSLEALALQRVALPPPGLYPFCSGNLKHLTLLTDPGPQAPAVAWSSVWAALRNVGAELSSLSVSVFGEGMDEMFHYLLSYSGLRKLKIVHVQMDTQTAEDTAGDVFWNEVIPQHKDSLLELVVSPMYEGSWCYGRVAASAITQCASLKRLDLRLCPVDEGWAMAEVARLTGGDEVKFPAQGYNASETLKCCPVLLLYNIRRAESPLEKLVINVTKPAERRNPDMLHLQRGTRAKGSRELYDVQSKIRRRLKETKSGLCNVQLPCYVGQTWPTVQIGYGMVFSWRENKRRGAASNTLGASRYGYYALASGVNHVF